MQFDQNWSKEDEHFSTKIVNLSQINQLFQKIQYPLCLHTSSLSIVSPYTGALLISVPMHRCPFHQCLHTPVPFPSVSPYTVPFWSVYTATGVYQWEQVTIHTIYICCAPSQWTIVAQPKWIQGQIYLRNHSVSTTATSNHRHSLH